MTHPFGDLPAQRRHLGDALRRLREAAGMSNSEIARRAGISQSRASRIEHGQQGTPAAIVQAWAQAAGAGENDLAEVLALAEAAATQAVSWRRAVTRGLVKLQQDAADQEATATLFLNFQVAIIPGLLQTPAYAERVFAYGQPPRQEQEIAAAAAMRMNRQVILHEQGRRFEFVIAEAALRWRLGGSALMRAQLDKVASVATMGNVSVGVIPSGAEADLWHDHGFALLDGRRDAGAVVHVETLTSGLTINGAEDVAAYQEVFAQLRDAAVTGEAAQRLIAAIAAEL